MDSGATPLLYEMGDPVDQGPGLAAAGAGNDQQRTVAMGYRLILGLVQVVPADRRNVAAGREIVIGKKFVLHGTGCTIEAYRAQ